MEEITASSRRRSQPEDKIGLFRQSEYRDCVGKNWTAVWKWLTKGKATVGTGLEAGLPCSLQADKVWAKKISAKEDTVTKSSTSGGPNVII